MEEEEEIINKYAEATKLAPVRKILNKESILALQSYVKQIPISKDLKQRVVKIVTATRKGKTLIE